MKLDAHNGDIVSLRCKKYSAVITNTRQNRFREISAGQDTLYLIDVEGKLWVRGSVRVSDSGFRLSRHGRVTLGADDGVSVLRAAGGYRHGIAVTYDGLLWAYVL